MTCYISLIHQNSFITLRKHPVVFSVIISSLYGITDELHQLFVPNRSCEFTDWMADFAGCIMMGLIIKYILSKKIKIFNTNSANIR